MKKILMMSLPSGDAGPSVGYHNHFQALVADDRFSIHESRTAAKNWDYFDFFWFYVPFSPYSYRLVKDQFPDKQIIVGPNVLLDCAPKGVSTDFENWFVDDVYCDFYINVADYYLKHVRRFFDQSKSFNALPYCINTKNMPKVAPLADREIDVLIYKKKRRNDPWNDALFKDCKEHLNGYGLSCRSLEYGSHNREDFIEACTKTKVCLWLSIEDYCSLAQLECYQQGTPIIGTKYNLTIPVNGSFQIDAQNFSPRDWISWRPDSASRLSKACKDFVEKVDRSPKSFGVKNVRAYLVRNHSFKIYADRVNRMLDGKA